MALTRESVWWWVGLVFAVVVGLAALDTSTAVETFGIPAKSLPYLRLSAMIAGIISAWMKTSPYPSKHDAPSVDLSKVGGGQ